MALQLWSKPLLLLQLCNPLLILPSCLQIWLCLLLMWLCLLLMWMCLLVMWLWVLKFLCIVLRPPKLQPQLPYACADPKSCC